MDRHQKRDFSPWGKPVPRIRTNLKKQCRSLLLALLVFTGTARAHIGSPDTFVQTTAGPYQLLLAIHPPTTYPGSVELDLRCSGTLTSATAALDNAPPTSVQIFHDGTAVASLWSTSPSAHKLHITVQGSDGPGSLTLNLPATAAPASPPTHSARWFYLVAAIGLTLAALRRRRTVSTTILLAASCGLLALAFLSHRTPPRTTLTAALDPTGRLDFTLTNPSETFTDLARDHGKLLHLFLIRSPLHDVFLHLHPTQLSPGHFTVQLPAMPPGSYTLFADFYHSNGIGETATLPLGLPAQFHSAAGDPDDSSAVLHPSSVPTASPTDQIFHLPDHYTMHLETTGPLEPLSAKVFQVTLLDPSGKPPADMALYLGMPAHAVVLRSDGSVFAHIHPGGTLPMLQAVSQIKPSLNTSEMPAGMPMPPVSNSCSIPYGFPNPGQYRLFVQMKHGPIIETAAFDMPVVTVN